MHKYSRGRRAFSPTMTICVCPCPLVCVSVRRVLPKLVPREEVSRGCLEWTVPVTFLNKRDFRLKQQNSLTNLVPSRIF